MKTRDVPTCSYYMPPLPNYGEAGSYDPRNRASRVSLYRRCVNRPTTEVCDPETLALLTG